MSTLKTAVLAAAFALCAVPGAFAAGSSLQLIIGGEAYDGPPKFEVTFNGKVLGEGAVNAAIDTATAGRFADAADKTPYVQSFSFDIPDDLFKPGGEVRVRLVNEAYGGDGSNRDRNLYLAAVAVNGRAVTVSGLSTQGTSADTANELLGEFLVLRDGNVEGVSRAPTGGWPLPDATIAAVQPAPEAVTTEVAAVAEVAEEPVPAATKPPVAVTALRLPESAADEKVVDGKPVETASLAAAATPTANPACDRDELYNVVGFNENSNDLTPKLMKRLDQIVADIGEQKCNVMVTGYSSRQGNHATNALFAIERAQNVLSYLKQAGLKFEEVSATGAGATEQFGDTFYANRRVVISVAP
jgi:outer membrane protein OmpA-like peptidoglycan-associated protein